MIEIDFYAKLAVEQTILKTVFSQYRSTAQKLIGND